MRILVVEDEIRLAETLGELLRREGYTADLRHDGESGLDCAMSGIYDMMILDVMLPKLDGFEVIRRLREQKIMFPVIVLSAKSEEESKIRGLEAGADDYLAKPFSLAELIARINAQLRRANNTAEPTELVYEDLRVNVISRKVFRNNERIYLQPLEYQLLEYLVRNKGQVVSKHTIMEHVWEYHFDPQTNIVESRMSRLRDKIDKPYDRKLIHTVRGFGYVLE